MMKKGEKQLTKGTFRSLFIGRSETTVITATILLILVFAFGSKGFLSGYNIYNVLRIASLYMIIAIGQAMVVIIGDMNVSLGAIGGLSVVAFGFTIQILELNPILCVLISIIVGTLLGFLNGVIITRFKLNAFVVTLATSFIFTGIVYGISKGNAYQNIPDSMTVIGRQGVFGLPYLFFIAVIILFILWYVFKFTVIGRRLLATGGNRNAARLSGINITRMVLLANMLSGFFAALAGILTISWLGIAPPSAGEDWLITSFAVAVIGGTALKGGEFTSIGIFFSGILIALVRNGLVMLEVNVYYEQTFLGLIILGAVMLESVRNKYLKQTNI